MIIRIVKMVFQHDKISDFLEIFNNSKPRILKSEGCRLVELRINNVKSTEFFTISHWDHENYLDSYRNSDLFKNTWNETKKLFSEKPIAWTLIDIDNNKL
jgi:quinol monooxygenase YgiN